MGSFLMDHMILNNLLHSLLFVIFFVIFVYLYKKAIGKARNYIKLPIIAQFLIILIASITVLVLYLNIFIPTDRDEILLAKINLAIQLGYFLLMITLFSFLLHSVKKENELKRKALEQEQFSQYMQALEQVNQDMRKFRHDYANILLSMRGFIEEENLNGLKDFFKLHILKAEEQTLFKNQVLSNLDNLKIIELKGLLATKVLLANQFGIKINVEIPEPIQTIHMDIIDLTRIIGILMDNAIEASQVLENGQINLAIMDTEKESVLIIIENQTNNTSMNIKQLFDENYSTKGKNRGIGLTTVRKVLKTYPNITMNTRIEDGWFVQEMEIQ